jgi:ribulose-phosphate 3-epimerase
MIDRAGAAIDLEVDGGIHRGTARSAVEAGARVLVAGQAIFGQPDRAKALRELREAAGS